MGIVTQVVANQMNNITVERGACLNIDGECKSRYTFSDFSAYVRFFEKHSNSIPSKAYIEHDLQIGPTDLRRRDTLHFNVDGELIEFWSRYRREIAGVVVQKKTAYPVHENGAIASINLISSQFIKNIYYPRQTNLLFDKDGNVLKNDYYPTTPVLKHDKKTFDNVLHRLGESVKLQNISVPKNSHISVDTLGQLQAVNLVKGQWNEGIYYPENLLLVVNNESKVETDNIYARLRKNETIETRIRTHLKILQKGIKLGRLTLPKGTLIEKSKSTYRAIHLLEEANICGLMKQKESLRIVYLSDGSFRIHTSLDKDDLVDQIKLKSGNSDVVFHDNCALKRGTLSVAQIVDGIPLAANQEIDLDRNGNIIAGTLGEAYSINNIKLSAGISFSFKPRYSVGLMLFKGGVVTDGDREYKSSFMQIYKHGVIAWGQLNKAAVIDGKHYEKGTNLKFYPDGKLISAELR